MVMVSSCTPKIRVRRIQFCLDSGGSFLHAQAMIEPINCAAVVPCFNEGSSIAPLVNAIRRHLPAVIVVDDGSTDETPAVARTAGAEVVRHERNLGKGAALKTGLSLALKRGIEWVLTLDGDGQHAPDDLPAFVACAEETGARLVVGNRMHNAEAIPWLRRRVNRWMSRKISEGAGRHLPDTQCGFRLIHLETWAGLPLKTEHFEVESEMLFAFLSAGYRVEFVPVQVIGRSRNSHINPVADTFRWLNWWQKESPKLRRHEKREPAGVCSPAGLKKV
jgi:glycosyltransferase involved in cell wall biosynthesis